MNNQGPDKEVWKDLNPGLALTPGMIRHCQPPCCDILSLHLSQTRPLALSLTPHRVANMNSTDHIGCDRFAADGAFGPIIDRCRPDFTFTFEQYIFSLVPSILFLFVAPVRIFALKKRQTVISPAGKPLQLIKLVRDIHRMDHSSTILILP